MASFKNSRKIRITREGKVFLLVSLGVGFAALNTGNNLLYLVLSLHLCLLVVQLAVGELNLRNQEVSRSAPSRTSVDVFFPVTFLVTNKNRFFPVFSLQIRDIINGNQFKRSCHFLKTNAGETRSIEYKGEISQRGNCTFSHVQLSSAFPFGLTERTKLLPIAHHMIIWPKKIDVVVPPTLHKKGIGPQTTTRKGIGDEYWQLRQFETGDDPKKVSWKASAKMNQLMVVDTQLQTDTQVDVVLQFHPPTGPASTDDVNTKAEKLIQITASILSMLNQQNMQTRLITPCTSGIWNFKHNIVSQLDHLALIDATALKAQQLPQPNINALIVHHHYAVDSTSIPPTTSPRKTG